MVVQLVEMGFNEDQAQRSLNSCGWDLNAAINQLLSGSQPSSPGGRSNLNLESSWAQKAQEAIWKEHANSWAARAKVVHTSCWFALKRRSPTQLFTSPGTPLRGRAGPVEAQNRVLRTRKPLFRTDPAFWFAL